jgi:hypothetical protein
MTTEADFLRALRPTLPRVGQRRSFLGVESMLG